MDKTLNSKRILIIKIGAIGDVIMALPTLTYFRKTLPPPHITWVAGKTVEPILRSTEKIDRIITVDEELLFKGLLFKKLSELVRIQGKLAGKYFDLILIGHVDWRYRLLALFARSGRWRSLSRRNHRQCPIPGRYHGNEYVRLASGLDGVDLLDAELPRITLQISKHLECGTSAIALAPGGAKNILADDALRRWPIDYYVDLARMFENRGIQVLLTGSSSDEWIVPYFKGLSCRNLVGKLDLLELMGLLQSVKLLITHDSGPLHLAKLARCHAIGLFGPTNPWEKVGAHDNIKVLWGGERLACRPCYDGKTYAACSKNKCLQSIHPELVLHESLKILDDSSITFNNDRQSRTTQESAFCKVSCSVNEIK